MAKLTFENSKTPYNRHFSIKPFKFELHGQFLVSRVQIKEISLYIIT